MWFFSARKERRTPTARAARGTFRPRLEALEDRCLLSAGALDSTFGTGGLVLGTNVPNATNAVTSAVVVQTDGKIVTGGRITVNGSINGNFALERYNADGTPDTSFGTNGVVQTVVGAAGSRIDGLALQSDGKIVAVGCAVYSTQPVVDEFAVARYLPNGSLDTTFGNGGIVTTNLVTATHRTDGAGWANAVAIQVDGKIDVGGISTLNGGDAFALVRYNANGTLDTTFGSSKTGIVVTPTFDNAGDYASALAIQSDGKILLVGNAGAGMAVARYNTNGSLDTAFGKNGIAMGLAPSGSTAIANGVLVQSNGDIVVAGGSHAGTSNTLTLARLLSNGKLDTAFGSSGFAVNSLMAAANAIAQGANGDLLSAGYTQNEPTQDFGVTAFLPGGTLDATFGTGGTTTADFSGGRDNAFAMAIQGDGKIVAGGSSYNATTNTISAALARFLPPDTKIGSFTATPNPVTAGGSVTLTVSGILNSNPTATTAQVTLRYVDNSGNTVVLSTSQTSPGVWTYTAPSGLTDCTGAALPSGTYTLYAQATDSNGVLSDPVAISFTVL